MHYRSAVATGGGQTASPQSADSRLGDHQGLPDRKGLGPGDQGGHFAGRTPEFDARLKAYGSCSGDGGSAA